MTFKFLGLFDSNWILLLHDGKIYFVYFRYVTLDGPLSDLLLSKGENIESFRWDDLLTRCQSKMGPAYQITFPGKPPALKKGKPDPVVINVAQRAGNKKVG